MKMEIKFITSLRCKELEPFVGMEAQVALLVGVHVLTMGEWQSGSMKVTRGKLEEQESIYPSKEGLRVLSSKSRLLLRLTNQVNNFSSRY